MLGKKESLKDKVLALGVHAKDLSNVWAPFDMRIYVLEKEENSITALVMSGTKFLGYRRIHTNKTLSHCDIFEEATYNVYKYKSNRRNCYVLSLVNAQELTTNFKNYPETFNLVGIRNEETKDSSEVTRTKVEQSFISYKSEHKQLLDFIEKHNTKKQQLLSASK